MAAAPPETERARAELRALFPLRDVFASRASALEAAVASTPPPRGDRLDALSRRYERLARLLETRIRLAAEVLVREDAPPR